MLACQALHCVAGLFCRLNLCCAPVHNRMAGKCMAHSASHLLYGYMDTAYIHDCLDPYIHTYINTSISIHTSIYPYCRWLSSVCHGFDSHSTVWGRAAHVAQNKVASLLQCTLCCEAFCFLCGFSYWLGRLIFGHSGASNVGDPIHGGQLANACMSLASVHAHFGHLQVRALPRKRVCQSTHAC